VRHTLVALVALVSSSATAHPVDEVVQAAYLAIEPRQVRLEFDISPGSAVSETILRDLDRDGDRRITTTESRAYGVRVLRRLPLAIDGIRVNWRLDQVGVPAYGSLAQQADTVRILAIAPAPLPRGGHLIGFTNAYRPAASVVMTNVFVRPAGAFRVGRQERSDDGRLYRVRIVT